MKVCSRCGCEKDSSEFYARKANRDGLRSECKACSRSEAKLWGDLNKERVATRSKKNYEASREKRLAQAKAWKSANPEKTKQHSKTGRDRLLERQPEYFKEYFRRYRSEVNPGAVKKSAKKWRDENTEYQRALTKAWSDANREHVIRHRKAWKSANRDLVNSQWMYRKAAKMKATPSWANRFFIKETYTLAVLRSQVTGIEWHVDHIVPLVSDKVCGLHVEQNLQVITAQENMAKSNRSWPDMP